MARGESRREVVDLRPSDHPAYHMPRAIHRPAIRIRPLAHVRPYHRLRGQSRRLRVSNAASTLPWASYPTTLDAMSSRRLDKQFSPAAKSTLTGADPHATVGLGNGLPHHVDPSALNFHVACDGIRSTSESTGPCEPAAASGTEMRLRTH